MLKKLMHIRKFAQLNEAGVPVFRKTVVIRQ